MKKLMLFAAVLGLTSVGQAEGEMTHKAEFRVRTFSEQGREILNDDSSNFTQHRFKLMSDYKASDRFSARLTLLHSADWGGSADVNIFNGTNPSTINQTIDNNGLAVNEAYVTWRVNEEFTIKMGRGTYEMADGSLVAVNDFQQGLTAFDGAAGIYETEVARIMATAIKFADYERMAPGSVASTPNSDGEAYSVGLSADLKLAPEIFNMMNFYALQVRRDEFNINVPNVGALPRPKESYLRYGTVLGGTIAEMVDFKAVYHGYTGERSNAAGTVDGDKEGNMYELEAGVTLEEVNNLNFYVGYHVDSGDDNAADGNDEHYDSFYYDIHANAGLMDVLRWGNLTYIKAGVSADVMENLNVGVHYHMFTATEEDDARTNWYAGPATLVAGEDDLGSEIDLIATHTYDGGLEIEARYGLFMSGDRFGPNAEDYQQFFLSGTFRF